MTSEIRQREKILIKLSADRCLAHEVLFAHRHPDTTPQAHKSVITSFHDVDQQKIVAEAFRGFGKSTIAEETICIRAGFREFKNGIIIGESESRAIERLQAVKHEIDTNDYLAELFGIGRGDVWQEHKISLSNGVVLQALGKGQSLRGVKHLDQRPDFCLIDDLEDDESVATPEGRLKNKRWLYRSLLPALEKNALVRYIGNRLDNDAVIVQLANDADWEHLKFPIMYRDEKGILKATWEARFPLQWIERKRAEYIRLGLLSEFMQEYMCEAGAPEEMIFKPEMYRVQPRVRVWEPVSCMFDPARTVNRKSATTGFAAWSWIGNKMVIWEGYGKALKPDEIINDIFRVDDQYRPMQLGIEKDGLEDFLMQPLRAEQVKRGRSLPLHPVNAPKYKRKNDFIRHALQPFFAAREIEFASEMPEARQQLLSFPTGNIDFVNALAYAIQMRSGAPIYENFTQHNVTEDLLVNPNKPVWLAMNATQSGVTGVLLQYNESISVLADWVEEGEASVVIPRLLSEAELEYGGNIRPIVGPQHFDHFNNVGLNQALSKVAKDVRVGTDPSLGREIIRNLLKIEIRGLPAFRVSSKARWTLNGFSGGFCREIGKNGSLSSFPKEGTYRLLIEGLESFAGHIKNGVADEEAEGLHYAYSKTGRRYISAMANR